MFTILVGSETFDRSAWRNEVIECPQYQGHLGCSVDPEVHQASSTSGSAKMLLGKSVDSRGFYSNGGHGGRAKSWHAVQLFQGLLCSSRWWGKGDHQSF